MSRILVLAPGANCDTGKVWWHSIQISLPKAQDVEKGNGAVSVLDNGPGLTLLQAQDALRAGFTSNNPYDRLGLFGMGFNISTGKLGRRTVFQTARKEVEVHWQEDQLVTNSRVKWYGKGTRSEYRLTRFGKGFPFLTPAQGRKYATYKKIDNY